MNVRSIQHPGVEPREIDLSEYFAGAQSVNTNNAYVMGFTDRGPLYDYSWITSEAQFIAIYGQPTNEAERYLYYAAKSILDNGGNAIVARMPYDNKQCKCYKALTLTYGVNKGQVGDYIGTEVYSNALIDLNDAAQFIGTVKDKGLTEKLFPRYSTIDVNYQIPKGYFAWQFLSQVSANYFDLKLLAKASTMTKFQFLTASQLSTLVEGTSFLSCIFQNGIEGAESRAKNLANNVNNLFTYSDFTNVYNAFREKYDVYTLEKSNLNTFNFSYLNYLDNIQNMNAIINGKVALKDNLDISTKQTLSSYVDGINKIFNNSTPNYVSYPDNSAWYKVGNTPITKANWNNNPSSYVYGSETSLSEDCTLTFNDVLVALNPTFEDYINFGTSSKPDLFYRGETENYMTLKFNDNTFTQNNITEITIPSANIDLQQIKFSNAATFTINGHKPSMLGVNTNAISTVFEDISKKNTPDNIKNLLSTTVAEIYAAGSSIISLMYGDEGEKVGLLDVLRIYNDPNLYKFTDEAVASIDANLLKEDEVGYSKMATLVSQDVLLSNYQYDSLVTTQNFEAQPDGDSNSVYGGLGCDKINNANYVIVDKLKTIANGSQGNEGYFVTVVDPFDALKLQRLLVNPFDDQENVFERESIKFWGMESNLAWGKKFDDANNTLDTLKRVKNANNIWVGEPGSGSKTNLMDSWSVPLTGNYKNESVSKTLMKVFTQIPLVTNQSTGQTTIDKAYSSHIVVAVCRTGINPSDGKIAVNVVETFFGSLFDEYNDITGETVYIGNLINENSNYIEFYKNMYVQPGFGGVNSKVPYNKTTVNQMFLKGTAELINAAALVGVNKDDYDVNEDFVPGNSEFIFDTQSDFNTYWKEHKDDKLYPAKVGTYYFKPTGYKKSSEENYDPSEDIILTQTIERQTDGTLKLGVLSQWKKSYDAFAYQLKKHNVYVFNKATTCLYNLYQNAAFTSFAQKDCEKKIANTTGIYSPVYGISQKVTSNLIQDMDYCIKFIQNTDSIPIYFVADAGISTIAQFCDNINWDSKNSTWVTQTFDPDNDPDVEDHAISSKDDVTSWWKVVNKLDFISRSVRRDCMTIIDAPRMMTLDGMAPKIRPSAWKNDFDELIGKKLRFISGMNSSYTAGYLTWFRTYDKFTGKAFWLPPTCKLIGNLMYLNTLNLPWLAPAGVTYGKINDIHAISLNPCASEEDQIYLKNWNYCKQYPTEGFVIEGQKTMLTKNSAFNRINVRTLFLDIERYVSNVARNYRYKVNNQFTREQFTNTIKSKLEDYTTRGGLYDFMIKCDESLNTAEVIDNQELRCAIYLKPGRLIEYVLVDYVCTKSDANFDEITY